ncbi:hypothetical protein Poli38472_006090 [Pythium oligandrum]|uniref:Fungal lipase-type domain-containing protein n=1 Tax=Pythium oligandrum TaxID=41045 RepID=A0A8K1CTR1_PYTOL|nr:hypothetical protein Poli38472_006090 [Pythium oligandrum]|eukprot:TMW68622.1 hypothetical protein Poli38472_006090 [Pythium oligandrum]
MDSKVRPQVAADGAEGVDAVASSADPVIEDPGDEDTHAKIAEEGTTPASIDVADVKPGLPSLSIQSPRLQQSNDGVESRRRGVGRLSAYVLQKASSFHRKVLKRNSITPVEEYHLKLGTLTSRDISQLYLLIRVAILGGPIFHIVWSASLRTKHERLVRDDALPSEAFLHGTLVIFATAYVRRVLIAQQQQRIQIAIAVIASLAGLVCAVMLTSNILAWQGKYQEPSSRLRSFANALLAGFIHLTSAHLTSHYSRLLLAATKDSPARQLMFSRRRGRIVSRYIVGLIVCYLLIRLVICWNSTVIYDFLPLTNLVTLIRIRWIEVTPIDKPTRLLVETLVISTMDAIVLAATIYKTHFVHSLFRHLFIKNFARTYTEYSVFVVYFRMTVVLITIGGHIAAWTAPIKIFLSQPSADLPRSVLYTGSAEQQVGIRCSLGLWFLALMYCALPADAIGMCGWFIRAKNLEIKQQRMKYFLYESDTFVKANFADLGHVGQIDPHHFILNSQVEAFNFAHLVYASGNKKYDQDVNSIQKLVGDEDFTIAEVVHDATTDTHCFILTSESKIVVTFRGTLSKTNARTDLQSSMALHLSARQLDLTKIPSRHKRLPIRNTDTSKRTLWQRLCCKRNPPKVHRGFYTAYLTVADRVIRNVQKLMSAHSRPVLVTGHSLGGALSVLCSFDIAARLRTANVTCTTFGCPRIGNHAFRKIYMHAVPATFAFVNASDVITKLPPKTPKAFSYASVGVVILINSFGNLVIEPNVLELEVLHRGYSTKAHSMKAYHLSLLRWCLRAHPDQFRPTFWRHSLLFLQDEFEFFPDVRNYLQAVLDEHLVDPGSSPTSEAHRLRSIARMLAATLREQRATTEGEDARDWVVQLWRWLRGEELREWFATDDAIRVLVEQIPLADDAAAIELGQTLTIHGFLKPERVVFGRHTRFFFLHVDDVVPTSTARPTL